GCNIIVAQCIYGGAKPRHGRWKPGREEMRSTKKKYPERTHFIEDAMGCLIVKFEGRNVWDANRINADGFPKFTQSFYALFAGIAGDQGGIHSSNRDASHPIRMQVRFSERLIHTGLV